MATNRGRNLESSSRAIDAVDPPLMTQIGHRIVSLGPRRAIAAGIIIADPDVVGERTNVDDRISGPENR
jgi:hypothetical protein